MQVNIIKRIDAQETIDLANEIPSYWSRRRQVLSPYLPAHFIVSCSRQR